MLLGGRKKKKEKEERGANGVWSVFLCVLLSLFHFIIIKFCIFFSSVNQHQRVDIHARALTAHKGLLQKRPEEDFCRIVPHVTPTTQSVKELN